MSHTVKTVEPHAGDGSPPLIVDSRERIEDSYADYLSDESRYGPAAAERLVVARSEEQVASVLTEAASSGADVTVSAGRTGIVGGAVPRGGVLLTLSEMKRVLGFRVLPDGRHAVRVEPGLSVAELSETLAGHDFGDGLARFYPPDPTEDTAHLGGTVATNASGARSFRYGATRRHVHSVRMCLTTGDVVDVERGQCIADGRRFTLACRDGGSSEITVPGYAMPATKNASGYFAAPGMDLVDLIVGSEGTLGVITEMELKLTEAPEGVLSALAFFGSDEDAVAFVKRARGDGPDDAPDSVSPMSLEFFDSTSFAFLRARREEEGTSSEIPELPDGATAGVLFEQDFTEDSLLDVYEGWEVVLSAHGSSMEDTWGGMEEGDLARLKALRHSVAEEVISVVSRANATNPEIHKIGTDAAVPGSALEETLALYRSELDGTGLSYIIFGHIGDNHLHLNVMPTDTRELALGKELALKFARRAVELGGTVSAEHGIGRLKHDFLRVQYGDEGLAEMAAVKTAFDPALVLNRGVMFPETLLRR